MPFVSRTRAILRRAEFGFFGVTVATRVQTPRLCGAATFFLLPCPDLRPGVVVFFLGRLRPLRISWVVFGTAAHGSGPLLLRRGRAGPRPASAPPPRRSGRRSRRRGPPWRRRSGRPRLQRQDPPAGRQGGRRRGWAGQAGRRSAPGQGAARYGSRGG